MCEFDAESNHYEDHVVSHNYLKAMIKSLNFKHMLRCML